MISIEFQLEWQIFPSGLMSSSSAGTYAGSVWKHCSFINRKDYFWPKSSDIGNLRKNGEKEEEKEEVEKSIGFGSKIKEFFSGLRK